VAKKSLSCDDNEIEVNGRCVPKRRPVERAARTAEKDTSEPASDKSRKNLPTECPSKGDSGGAFMFRIGKNCYYVK
jgi:hypothetical protein